MPNATLKVAGEVSICTNRLVGEWVVNQKLCYADRGCVAKRGVLCMRFTSEGRVAP